MEAGAERAERAAQNRAGQDVARIMHSELAEPFGLAQPTISKHLRVLEEAGLIEQGRDAQRRPRTLVVGGPLKDVDLWLEPFRQQWERRFDALDEFLQKEKKRKTRTKRTKRERR